MSSVHKKPKSPYWHCNYFDSVEGKQKYVSTKTTDKEAAQRICDGTEKASREAAKNLTPEVAIELIKVTRKAVSGNLTVAEGEDVDYIEIALNISKAPASAFDFLDYQNWHDKWDLDIRVFDGIEGIEKHLGSEFVMLDIADLIT